MTQPFKLYSLAALSLACALLAGCGGGDAEAPPSAAVNAGGTTTPAGPDTTPPSLLFIRNDISADTATGPVTFTFVFSEDVSTTFTADDVVVTGGTKGAFSRLPGGTQATLVVTPTPNSTGSIAVSVAAGTFADLATNANLALTSSSKPFDTTVVTPPPPGPTGSVLTIVQKPNTGPAPIGPGPSYDTANGKALPANYVTGRYAAGAGEAGLFFGDFAEQLISVYGFSSTNTAQWGFGLFIQNGGTGWDISTATNYHFNAHPISECVNKCGVTVMMVSTQAGGNCKATALVPLTADDPYNNYNVSLTAFTVAGCTTNTMAAFKQIPVAELHFQMLRADMQFVTGNDGAGNFPNGMGIGGNIYFDVASTPVTPPGTPLTVVQKPNTGPAPIGPGPSYDIANGKALPANFVTGRYAAGAGEAGLFFGDFAEQLISVYGFSSTNAAQWGFGLFIQHGGAGWDISNKSNYHFNAHPISECVNKCGVTVMMVSTQAGGNCKASALVPLTVDDPYNNYNVSLATAFTVTGCTTNTMAAFKQIPVAELHFQMLRADMQFVTGNDGAGNFPNGMGIGGNVFFD